MKFITRRKQNEILKRIADNELIAKEFVCKLPFCEEHIRRMESFVDNSAEISYIVGGVNGMKTVMGILEKSSKKGEETDDLSKTK